jgi:hypothetical protein
VRVVVIDEADMSASSKRCLHVRLEEVRTGEQESRPETFDVWTRFILGTERTQMTTFCIFPFVRDLKCNSDQNVN